MSLKHNDLIGTILPIVSIDEFKPKSGNIEDIIVVAFYLNEKNAADDLNTFIQRGAIDSLDIEASPNTDEDGRYLVFVEMDRNDTFPNKFQALLKDVQNVSNKMDWKIKPYLSDTEFESSDPELYNFIITDPTKYVSKDDFTMASIKENIETFFKNSFMSNLTINGNSVIISGSGKTIISEIVDVGDYDTVIERNFLAESAFGMSRTPYEAKILQSIIGNCQVLTLGKYLCVNRDDQIMLLKNTHLTYGKM